MRYGRRRQGPFGGKHIELFEMFKSWRDDPEAQTALAVEEGWIEEGDAESYRGQLEEAAGDPIHGTGAPEGRADFPIFLLSMIRHTMRQAFTRRAAKWDQYVGVERAEDFRINTVSQLNGLTGMGPVDEFDEYNRIRGGEEAGPPFSVGKHGGVYGVTFEMVVNDDANLILNRTPTELGRMSAAYVAQVVTALIEGNPNWIDGNPFFGSTPRNGLPAGNEYTGAAAEPTEDNFVQIIEDMRGATDSEGFPIDIDPQTILTKSERVALNLARIKRSQETGVQVTNPAGTTADKGTYNVLQDTAWANVDPIVEPYLKDPNDFLTLSDIGRPAFVIAFLRDMRDPFIGIKSAEVQSVGGGAPDPYTLDFDEILYKLRHIFGVALGDPRAVRRARRA